MDILGNPYKALARLSPVSLLVLLLLISLLIRLFLILKSGALVHYDGPEYFDFSNRVYRKLARLDFEGALTIPVFAHWGCILFGTIPFFIKTQLLSPQQTSAVFFALPSVINIFLVYRIALKFALPQRTALIAATLYALSFSGIYQVRHVLPHDLALSFFLIGILTTLSLSATRKIAPLLAGLCYFLCFFTYYGYWTLAFIGLLFSSLHNSSSLKIFILKGCSASAGFFLPLMFFLAIGHAYGVNYWQHFIGFSQTITMGSFAEGYSLPFFFLFYAEGLLLAVWLACIAIALTQLQSYAIKCCLIGIGIIYGLLIAGSHLFEYFVVYGRLVKAIIPLLCLLSACVLSRLNTRTLVVLFILLLPGFIANSYQLHKTTFWADISKSYQAALKLPLPEDRQLLLGTACEPQLDICGAPITEGCAVVRSFLDAENQKFFQYDAINPAVRNLSGQYRLYHQIRDCPKQN